MRGAPEIIVGLMSGTSLDGVSAAVVRIGTGESPRYGCELLASLTRPYPSEARERLARAVRPDGGLTPDEWTQLNADVGAWLADAAVAVIAQARLTPSAIRAVASHGQTMWHAGRRATWQIGEAAVIAEQLERPVVSNFRVRDVAAGGEGAPLVPMADLLLFSSPDGGRALQNLGGIANVTVVPPVPSGATIRALGQEVMAFDTGPGMVLIDAVVRALHPGLPYDVDGELSARGTPITEVLDSLMADPYFTQPPPKSTGREHFSDAYAARMIARCRSTSRGATSADVAATALALTVRSIREAYGRFIRQPYADVVVSGGGARNPTLMRALTAALAPSRVQRFSDLFFDDTAKEAVAFALLGYLHLYDQPGNLPSATGARGPRVLGTLTPA